MPLEVYSAAKPAVRYRAPLLSISIFALASSLAGGLTLIRHNSPLGPPFVPKGWGLSIRLPRIFNAGRASIGGTGATIEFQASIDDAESITFTLHQIPVRRGETAEAACRLALPADGGLLSIIRRLNPSLLKTAPATMGGIAGAELHDPALGSFVRGVIVEPERAFCVSIHSSGGALSDRAYALFDASCASVRFDRRE